MRLFIPSLGRADRIHQGTLGKLPTSLHSNTTVVCQAHEASAYRAALLNTPDVELMVLPKSITRIEPTRRHIAEACDMVGVEKFCMLDDDIEFYIRRDQEADHDEWWKLTAPGPEDIYEMFASISRALHQYAHVGVSGREGNNRTREGEVENTRYMRLLAYRTADYLATEGGRVHIMEDFDVALQMLRAGLPSLVFYRFAQGQSKTQADGGCSVWRTHQVHNAGAEKLAELHPGFVRTRQKQNKTDREGFGTRTEVTVYWKKAFASSIPPEEELPQDPPVEDAET
jgi:hypothetical protein